MAEDRMAVLETVRKASTRMPSRRKSTSPSAMAIALCRRPVTLSG